MRDVVAELRTLLAKECRWTYLGITHECLYWEEGEPGDPCSRCFELRLAAINHLEAFLDVVEAARSHDCSVNGEWIDGGALGEVYACHVCSALARLDAEAPDA